VHLNRNLAIAGSVVVFHAALIWAIQTGLIRRAVEVIVPVEMLSSIITPPVPKPETPPPPPPVPVPVKQPAVTKARPAMAPAPQPMAIADPTPAPNAPTGVATPPAPLAPIQAPVSAAPTPAAAAAPAAAPARVEQPTSDASYLNNPSPVYPAVSRRLGEQGKVLVRVLIGADGVPQKADLAMSSGFARLDQSALEYVMKCRYIPGKVGGVPQAMTHIAPVNFVLN